ncbi:MAG: glycosyltransferase [Promethearchaeota archaeon]|jgi:cellulose synthase/poly-beta-1,6-N-acetylglucosamine synthase-like glycosyltransferase
MLITAIFQWIILFNIVATFLWLFQIIFGFLSYRKSQQQKFLTIQPPKLSIIIPAYNEINHTIQKVVDSVIIQRNVEVEVFVVDDGSASPVVIQDHSKVQLLSLKKNRGKRYAQIHAIRKATSKWIVTVDSDTILDPNALYELYKATVANNWDATTGNVKLLNEEESFLTRLTACLYWYGFCQERASQSYFDDVTCCSGALSLWRKEVILETAELYLTQQFMGRDCVAGDDRYLTCLFALKGKKVGFAFDSIAYTISPSTFSGFVKQQLRWTRSNTPAFLFAIRNVRQISLIFLAFMTAVVFRYAYFAILYVYVLCALILGHMLVPVIILLIILAISGIKACNAFLYTGKWRMFYLMPLSILSFFVLSPVIIYGALTPTVTGWMTRTKKDSFLEIRKDKACQQIE